MGQARRRPHLTALPWLYIALAGGGVAVAAVDVDSAHGWGLVEWLDGWEILLGLGSVCSPLLGDLVDGLVMGVATGQGQEPLIISLPVANDRSYANHHLGARST